QGSAHDVGHHPDRLHGGTANRRRMSCSADEPIGGGDLDRTQQSLVPRDPKAQGGNEPAGDTTHQAGSSGVDESGALGTAVSEVEQQVISRLRENQVDSIQRVAVAVVFEEIPYMDLAVGHQAKALTSLLLSFVDYGPHRGHPAL